MDGRLRARLVAMSTTAHYLEAVERLFTKSLGVLPRELIHFQGVLVRQLGKWRVRLGLIPEGR